MAVEELLKNIKNKIIQRVTIHTKNNYKTNKINTFPQIYIKNKNKTMLLGGYSDIKEIYDILSNHNNLDQIIKYLKKKYSHFDRKILLRIIKIFY